ncbi:MAG: RHS repeat domain-containing protein [Flavobacteriaceae bacterium]
MGGEQLQFFSTPEGYVTPGTTEGQWAYVYQYKDHLGNVRLSYTDADGNGTIDPDNEIIEENNHYPFGMRHRRYNYGGDNSLGSDVAQKWKYNGVEFEDALGLGLYEMPFRQFDPAIARWTRIDPVVHYSNSTYNGFDNNPVYWADPSGADTQTLYDLNGNAWTVDCENSECDNARRKENKEGDTRPEMVGVPRGGAAPHKTKKEYYHQGGIYGSEAGWYSESDYLDLFWMDAQSLSMGGALSTGTIELIDRDGGEKLLELIVGYAQSIYDARERSNAYNASGHAIPLSFLDFLPGKISYTALRKLGKNFFKKTIKAVGEEHHLVSTKVARALDNHPILNGAFDYSRTNKKYIYRALNQDAHRGYQTWHRLYDATVVKWLQTNPRATEKIFNEYLHNLHQQPWLKERIPNVNLLD